MPDIQKRCTACGSEKIIQAATIRNGIDALNDNELGEHGEPLVTISANPRSSAAAQRYVLSRIHAWICGDCGSMQFFADDPKLLFAAYQEFLRATRG